MKSEKIVLIGASLRALIPSALLAGRRPVCFDLFADWDSCQYPGATVHQLPHFSRLLTTEFQPDDGPALLCGGCELRTEIVGHLERRLGLCGHSAASLQATADRYAVLCELERAGLDLPLISRAAPQGSPLDWLVKPDRGCGGGGIRHWKASAKQTTPVAAVEPPGARHYFQQRITGQSLGALFFSDAASGNTWLIGLTRQLVGQTWAGAGEFAYCGSIHESLDQHPAAATITHIGKITGSRFSLQGLWGIDVIVAASRVLVVDVNVRIPASAELLETAIRLAELPSIASTVGLHITEATGEEIGQVCRRIVAMDRCRLHEAKVVLFNPSGRNLEVAPRIARRLTDNWDRGFFQANVRGWSIADIPRPDSCIAPGHPILTLRLRGAPEEVAEDQLIEKAAEVYRLLELP